MGMEQAGHKCLGYAEWDQHARNSYQAIHDTKGEWTAHDVTTVSDNDLRLLREKGVDIICGGFPCQAFSIAGKRGGLSDTRGTLFFEIARFAKEIKPRFLFLENVKGLLSDEDGRTFGTILHTLDGLGYDVEWQVLNSKNFGVPQHRERLFIIGHLRGESTRPIFPIERSGRQAAKGFKDGLKNGVAIPVLTPRRAEKRQRGRRFKTNGEPMFTLTSQDRHGVTDGKRVRVLTPRECWRLQGFPDWAFDKAAQVTKDPQLYKQAGNSVTVNVIYEIAKKFN